MRILKGLEQKLYEEQLRTFDMFRLEKRKLKGRQDLTVVLNILRSGSRRAGRDLFSLVISDRTQ